MSQYQLRHLWWFHTLSIGSKSLCSSYFLGEVWSLCHANHHVQDHTMEKVCWWHHRVPIYTLLNNFMAHIRSIIHPVLQGWDKEPLTIHSEFGTPIPPATTQDNSPPPYTGRQSTARNQLLSSKQGVISMVWQHINTKDTKLWGLASAHWGSV